jgi:hypothetical protein
MKADIRQAVFGKQHSQQSGREFVNRIAHKGGILQQFFSETGEYIPQNTASDFQRVMSMKRYGWSLTTRSASRQDRQK